MSRRTADSNKAIAAAWENEQKRVNEGKGTRDWTPKQQKVLAALLREPTQKAAAASTGVSDRQIREYLSKPEFQEAYRQALSQLVLEASFQARNSLGEL